MTKNTKQIQPFQWVTNYKADEEFLRTLFREKEYEHYSDAEKIILKKCLKWFYETHDARLYETNKK